MARGSRISDERQIRKDTNPEHAETLHKVAANYDDQDDEAELQCAMRVDRLAEAILDRVISVPFTLLRTVQSAACFLSTMV